MGKRIAMKRIIPGLSMQRKSKLAHVGRLGRSALTVKQHLGAIRAMRLGRHVDGLNPNKHGYDESVPFGSSEASHNIPAGTSDFRMVRKVMNKGGILR